MRQNEYVDDPVYQKYLYELVGSEGIPVALSPSDAEETDEEIAERIDVDVNIVRRALIILNENDLASYRRQRDEESGWLTYYWKFEYQNIPDKLEEHMEHLLDLLQNREEYERYNEFYRCPVCGERQTFDEATGLQFVCPRCGSDVEAEQSDKILTLVQSRRQELEDELQES